MNALKDNLLKTRILIDTALEEVLKKPDDLTRNVVEAMRYSAIGAGKAFRPFLIFTVGSMYHLSEKLLMPLALALEMVHTYSLIHDDLPAMDNDTLRRGKPTCHIQFDEATAILAGDALLTQAFEILSDKSFLVSNEIKITLISKLAQAAGHAGMIGGQMIDLTGEKHPLTLEEIRYMQQLKTGALLKFACEAPAIVAQADRTEQQALSDYAKALGELFQMTDDMLDESSTSAILGKSIGKDKNAHKSTFVTLLGLEGAKQAAQQAHQAALDSLALFKNRGLLLKETADYVLTRDR